MNIRICLMALLSAGNLLGTYAAEPEETTIKLLETSDVHGAYFPYDFITRQPLKGSLARVSTYLNEQRKLYGEENVLLMDNGDILQGQPVAYYYNFIDTASTHVCAAMLNYLKYDVGNMGNHDIETGHAVYDRWTSQCRFPMLGANIIDRNTNEPYLPPYRILERDGVRIAVLGMITPAIPSWLPETMWSGLRFEDMETCARHWVEAIRKKEHPDVLVGLFHAGPEGNLLDNVIENGSQNVAGDSVLLINPANAARTLADVTLKITRKDGRIVSKSVEGRLADVTSLPIDQAFIDTFAPQYQATLDFVSRKIGSIRSTITTRDAFFGPSAFIDLPRCLLRSLGIHRPDSPTPARHHGSRHFLLRPALVQCRNQGRRHLHERYVQPLQIREPALHDAPHGTRNQGFPRNVVCLMDQPNAIAR